MTHFHWHSWRLFPGLCFAPWLFAHAALTPLNFSPLPDSVVSNQESGVIVEWSSPLADLGLHEVAMTGSLTGPVAGVPVITDQFFLFAPVATFQPGEIVTVEMMGFSGLDEAFQETPLVWSFEIQESEDTVPTPTLAVDEEPIGANTGHVVEFGITYVGTPVDIPFTVHNPTEIWLNLSDPQLPVAGFSLPEGLPEFIAPGESETFPVRLTAEDANGFSGFFSFATDAPNLPQMSTTLVGVVLAPEQTPLFLLISPEKFQENASPDQLSGSILRADFGPEMDVRLTVSEPDRLWVPDSVWLDEAALISEFPLIPQDNDLADGTVDIVLRAEAEGYTPVEYTVRLVDDESLEASQANSLMITVFRPVLLEDEGMIEWGGMVERLGDTSQDLTVELNSSDLGELQIPASITLEAGVSLEFFSLSPQNDQILDGLQWVTLTASAPGMEQAQVLISVDDVGLATAALAQLTPEDLANLDKQAFQNAEDEYKIEMLTSLDASVFTPEYVESLELLDQGWDISDTGEIIVPPDTELFLRELEPVLEEIELELALFDLSCAMTLGCIADQAGELTLLQEIDAALAQIDFEEFEFSQQDDGVLFVDGTGDFAEADFAFFPDPEASRQLDKSAQVGLSTAAGGEFLVTTEKRKQIGLIPAPKNLGQFKQAVGQTYTGQVKAKIGKRGDILVEVADARRAGGRLHQVFVPDPQIQRNVTQAPGLHIQDANNEAIVVYADQTAQRLFPSVRSPDTFQREAQKIPGVKKVRVNVDGTFRVELATGPAFLVKPTFDTRNQPKPNGVAGTGKIELVSATQVRYTYYENGTETSTMMALTPQ